MKDNKEGWIFQNPKSMWNHKKDHHSLSGSSPWFGFK